jgi:hypothetical protein
MSKPLMTIVMTMQLLLAAAPVLQADEWQDAALDRRANNVRALLNISDAEKAKAIRKAVGEYYDAGAKSDESLLKLLSDQSSAQKVEQEKTYIEMLLAMPLGTEPNPPVAEAAYGNTIGQRALKIVETLNITDKAKSEAVERLIINQFRALHDNDAVRDAKLKAPGANAEAVKAQTLESRKILHDVYLANLNQLLTPEQVEKVKDGHTPNKVNFTFTGYKNEYPGMNEEQQAKVLAFLKEAREQAMDGGDSKEKDAIFNKYKGKINNYLASEKVPSKKASASKPATPPEN